MVWLANKACDLNWGIGWVYEVDGVGVQELLLS